MERNLNETRLSDLELVKRFFTEPRMTDKAIQIAPHMRKSLAEDAKSIALDGLEFRVNRNGGVLLDGERVVGSIGRLNKITLDVEYRGRGLAVAMIKHWAMNNRWYVPSDVVMRTQNGATAYRRAWEGGLADFYAEVLQQRV